MDDPKHVVPDRVSEGAPLPAQLYPAHARPGRKRNPVSSPDSYERHVNNGSSTLVEEQSDCSLLRASTDTTMKRVFSGTYNPTGLDSTAASITSGVHEAVHSPQPSPQHNSQHTYANSGEEPSRNPKRPELTHHKHNSQPRTRAPPAKSSASSRPDAYPLTHSSHPPANTQLTRDRTHTPPPLQDISAGGGEKLGGPTKEQNSADEGIEASYDLPSPVSPDGQMFREVVGEKMISHPKEDNIQDLFEATRKGDVQRVTVLLQEQKLSPDTLNKDGQPPLMVALAQGHDKVVKILLEFKASHTYKDKHGNTLLHIVAGKGNYGALKTFLDCVQLPEVNGQNQDGNTCLMAPSERGFSIVVECLLQHHADPNIPNHVGRTAIMAAASKGHKEVIKALLKHGADVLVTSNEECSGMPTALREALANGSSELISLVAEACNEATRMINTLYACKTMEEVQKLTSSGLSVHVNQKRGDGCTPLMVHAELGNVAVVTCLIEKNALLDTQDKDGQTALMKSSFRGHINVVKLLVEKQALMDIRCKNGRTAMHYGTIGQHLDVVKFLHQSGADHTIPDNNGLSAEDMAQQHSYTDIKMYLKDRSVTNAAKLDPFTLQISRYLKTKASAEKKSTNGSITASDEHSGTRHPPTRMVIQTRIEQQRTKEDDSALKKELDNQRQRVAELEARVEELTIQAQFTVKDDEDLEHYRDQPDRLIEEFKKMKMAKKKATQFAIEAKQTAQKVSVELCRTQEDLAREKHANELNMKKIVTDVEQAQNKKETKEDVLQEKADAAEEEVIRLTGILNKIIEKGKVGEGIHGIEAVGKQEFNAKDLLLLILNGRKKAHIRAALVACTGLPKSGKSTLLKTLLPHTTADKNSTDSKEDVKGLATYEIGIPMIPGGTIPDSPWEEFTREDAHIYMLAYALADACKVKNKLPSLKPWSDQSLAPTSLKSQHLQNEFKKVYEKMTKVLPRVTKSPYFHCILKPMIIFMNVWDIGVSKALYEALPLLARVTNSLVLINLLDLARDSNELAESPQLTREDEKEFIMRFRSRCHYYVRIAGLCTCKSEEVPASVLVATHKDKVPSDEVSKRTHLTEAVVNAKAGDMGVLNALYPKMMAIDAHNVKHCRSVQYVLEEIVCLSKQFEKDLHLTWIFLRTALIDYKTKSKFRISYNELSDLAMQCGLTSKREVDEFLSFFSQIGSLLFMQEFLHENIIYKIDIFFQELNKLYTNTKSQEHAKTSLENGILCRNVAVELWEEDVDFFWDILQESGLAALTRNHNGSEKYDYGITCPYESCNETECLFIPSLRKEYKKRAPNVKVDSLFITFNSEYVPTDIQAVIVKHMKSVLPEAELKQTRQYNSTKFVIGQVSVEVMVHGDVVEIFSECKRPEVLCPLKHLCVHILEAVIKYFPKMEYELGFICPNSEESDPLQRRKVHYVHFLPSQCETELYCVHCHENIVLRPGQLEWMRDAEKTHITSKSISCPVGLTEAGMVTDSKLASVVKLIPFEQYLPLCATLGLPNPEFISPSMVSTHLESGLKNWQVTSPTNRRQKLAKVLFLDGSYVAALKLDAKLIHANISRDAHESLSPLEVETVLHFITDWKILASCLNVPADVVKEIETANIRERDCCRKLLKAVAVEKRKMIDVLEEMEYYALADSLMCETMRSNYMLH